MGLNADVLGNALYSKAMEFNDKEIEDLETARRAFWKGIATEVINHFKESGDVVIPALGLAAPNGPVTGEAHGKIT